MYIDIESRLSCLAQANLKVIAEVDSASVISLSTERSAEMMCGISGGIEIGIPAWRGVKISSSLGLNGGHVELGHSGDPHCRLVSRRRLQVEAAPELFMGAIVAMKSCGIKRSIPILEKINLGSCSGGAAKVLNMTVLQRQAMAIAVG